jgi:hypothetical protein
MTFAVQASNTRDTLLMRTAWLALVAVVGGLCAWAGSRTTDPFAGNLWSEAVGLAASLVIAVVLVERVQSAHRRNRWRSVESVTLVELANRLKSITNRIESRAGLPSSFQQHLAAHLGQSQIWREGQLAQMFAAEGELKARLEGGRFRLSPARSFGEDLRAIRGPLLMRVIEWADDPELVGFLLGVEKRASDLRTSPDAHGWDYAIDLHEAVTAAYGHVLNKLVEYGAPTRRKIRL